MPFVWLGIVNNVPSFLPQGSQNNNNRCAETYQAVAAEEFVRATKRYCYKNECLQLANNFQQISSIFFASRQAYSPESFLISNGTLKLLVGIS